MHDLSYQYVGVALARLSAEGGTVVRWGGLYIALARLSAGGGTVVRWGVAIYSACTPPCLWQNRCPLGCLHASLPSATPLSASFLECLLVFVQKRFEVLGLRFEDAGDDEYLLQCL